MSADAREITRVVWIGDEPLRTAAERARDEQDARCMRCAQGVAELSRCYRERVRWTPDRCPSWAGAARVHLLPVLRDDDE